MKRLLLLLTVLVGVLSLGAQAVKLGYVNTDRLLLESNEAAEVARLFTLDKQNWQNQIRQMDEEIKRLERDFDIRKLTMNDATKRDTQGKIDAKKAEAGRLLEEYFGDNGKAEQRYKELIDPLTAKIDGLIKKTALDEKYTMLFDVSMGVVLYALPTLDITEQILLELNKDTVKPVQDEPKPDPNAIYNQDGYKPPEDIKPEDGYQEPKKP
ncbi:MAG: OmpH family outer membrane protein [Candidatus Cloacimonetes bacterium]|nr:OmpH family outer membrane protein [Candidatus Cloacimonadota bacterium]